MLIRRSLFILLLICMGCAAQSAPPDVARKVEHQVRSFYTIPADVKVIVGSIVPSNEMPGYDSVPVKIDGGDGKPKDYQFLISKDRATMLRVTKFDLNKDPFADLMSKSMSGAGRRGATSPPRSWSLTSMTLSAPIVRRCTLPCSRRFSGNTATA